MRRVPALLTFLILGYLLSSPVPTMAANAAAAGPAVCLFAPRCDETAGSNFPISPNTPRDIVLTPRTAR